MTPRSEWTRKWGCCRSYPRGPRREGGGDEQGVAEPALQRRPLLDRGDDSGVVADARVEAEEPTVDLAEADRPEVAGVDAVGQQLDGRDRVVGQADRAGEHVRRSARQRAERGVGAGDARGHLVERAVATEPDDDVDARAERRRGRSAWRDRGGWSRRARPGGCGSAGGARRRCCAPSPTTRTSSPPAGSASSRTYQCAARPTPGGTARRVGGIVDPSVTMSGHERHRLRQADPGPGAGR